MTKRLPIALLIAISLLFLFLRLYHLNDSLFFFNDWGRDMLTLQKWQQTGLPPLLGPLTSALPFNQSAVYFYLLYPGFLLFGGHPISSVFTLIVFYLIIFTLLFFYFKKSPKLTTSLLLTCYLITIHPQFIGQNRFVWNPSFVAPLILLSYFSYYLLLRHYSSTYLFIFSSSLALAVSLSYSVAPLFIAFFLHWLIFYRRHFGKFFLFLFAGLLFFNLPTLFFELRHHFFLTGQLFTQAPAVQAAATIMDRFHQISNLLFSFSSPNLNLILFLIFLTISLFQLKKLPYFLFFITSIISLLLPITFHYQYIFPLLCLLFLIISTLPRFLIILILLLFSSTYLNTTFLTKYFQTANRTYDQMNTCFQNFCQSFPEPLFVSTQASFHPFHNGPEHRYLLRKNDCDVRDIETQNGQAQSMLVVEDGDQLTPQTHYYELDLFSKYQEKTYFPCQENFNLRLLQKITAPPTGS